MHQVNYLSQVGKYNYMYTWLGTQYIVPTAKKTKGMNIHGKCLESDSSFSDSSWFNARYIKIIDWKCNAKEIIFIAFYDNVIIVQIS